MDTRSLAEKELKQELRWAKEIEAVHEQEIGLHLDFVPEEHHHLTELSPPTLREHIQRLEHDLQDLKENRIEEDGFEEIDWERDE